MKMGWMIIDRRGDMFEHALRAETREEAIKEALSEWRSLGAYDWVQREAYELIYTETDDENTYYEKATECIDIKAFARKLEEEGK